MGFDNETLESLHDELAEIDVDQLPIDAGDPPTKEVYFMNPEKVCEVGFSQCTKADRLRHPRFNGMRRDKTATDLHKEDESEIAEIEEGQDEN